MKCFVEFRISVKKKKKSADIPKYLCLCEGNDVIPDNMLTQLNICKKAKKLVINESAYESLALHEISGNRTTCYSEMSRGRGTWRKVR